VFCQLETLRHSVQPDVLGILERLPKTLDETYERLLKNINVNNQRHARYLLHCLAVSVRPLRVEELAEILTFDFDAAEGGIPKYRPDRRPNNQEAAILSICSNLITIVDNRGSRVVQFSHLSVKEFLTSNHLASSREDLSMYHILPAHAHTILAQVCLGLLLHPNNRNGDKSVEGSPLVEYAAHYWVTHAQFEDVATGVMGGIESLLDPDKPHFSSWVRLFDPDGESSGRLPWEIPSPLYYLVLCGFHHDLVRHIAVKHPEHVNATCGPYGFPLDAALCRNNFPVAEILLKHGGRVDVRDARDQTALHKTIDRRDKVAIDRVQFLLEHGADVNAQRDDLWTPLHLALHAGELNVARMLLDHQADVNARNDDGQAPLHLLSRWEAQQDEDDGSEDVRRLLECGANVNEKDKDNATPLHLASYYKRLEIVRVLLDGGANIDMENDQGKTPLQIALMDDGHSKGNGVGVARLLLAHGAEVYARDKFSISTTDLACCFAKENIGQVLLGNGDPSQTESSWGEAFRLWMEGKYYSQGHTSRSSHIVPRVRHGGQRTRHV
jgi:ankyrin repeat protein